jgi:hypothetical protein
LARRRGLRLRGRRRRLPRRRGARARRGRTATGGRAGALVLATRSGQRQRAARGRGRRGRGDRGRVARRGGRRRVVGRCAGGHRRPSHERDDRGDQHALIQAMVGRANPRDRSPRKGRDRQHGPSLRRTSRWVQTLAAFTQPDPLRKFRGPVGGA